MDEIQELKTIVNDYFSFLIDEYGFKMKVVALSRFFFKVTDGYILLESEKFCISFIFQKPWSKINKELNINLNGPDYMLDDTGINLIRAVILNDLSFKRGDIVEYAQFIKDHIDDIAELYLTKKQYITKKSIEEFSSKRPKSSHYQSHDDIQVPRKKFSRFKRRQV